jgi:magnesium-transporting ATPase (P-type)
MKRELIVFVLLSLLLVAFSFSSVLGADFGDVEDRVGGLQDKVDDTEETVEEYTDAERWEYLSFEWKKLLLKNKAIGGIDSFLSKVDSWGVFVFLIAENYDLSLTFFFALIFWIFFFFIFNSIFRNTLPLSKGVSSLIAFAATVIVGHLGIYSIFSTITFKLIFYKQSAAWGWVWTILFGIAYIFILVYANQGVKWVMKWFKERKEKKKEKEEKEELKAGVKRSDSFIKGFKEGEGRN